MLSRFALQRSFSAAARPSLTSTAEEKVSRVQSGLTVASVDLHGPVTQLVLAFRAGSRYEQPDEAGLVHHLRNSIGKDSERYLGVKLLWQAGGLGSNLTATATKDLLAVQLNVSRNYAPVALSLLGELAEPASKPWDVHDVYPSVKLDLAHQQPFDITIDLLHKAAYRNGSLANSILADPHRGSVGFKKLSAFSKSRLVSSEAALVAVNLDRSVLLRFATEQGSIPEGSPKQAVESKYFGGDARLSTATPLAYVAIAGNGAKLSDVKSVAIQAVLAAVIGKESNLEHTNRPGSGFIAKAVENAVNHQPIAVSGLNIVHSDGGLAGVYLAGKASAIESAVRAAVDGLKKLANSGPDAELLDVAKRNAAIETLVRSESSSEIAFDQAAQLLASGSAVSPSDFAKQINEVSTDDIKKAAQKIVSKLTVAAYGNTHTVPYADQI
jgi:ubiquinol-cytochrome c reductase core subunit 2